MAETMPYQPGDSDIRPAAPSGGRGASWLGPLANLDASDWMQLAGAIGATLAPAMGYGPGGRMGPWGRALTGVSTLAPIGGFLQNKRSRSQVADLIRQSAPGPVGELAATGAQTGETIPQAVYDVAAQPAQMKIKQAMLDTLPADFPNRKILEQAAQDPGFDPKLLENRIDWLKAFSSRDEQAQQRLDLQGRSLALRQTSSLGRNQLISDEDAQFRAQQALRGDYMGAFTGLGYGGSRAMNSQKVHDALRAQGFTGGDIVMNRAQLDASRAELKNLQVYRGRVNVALDTLDKNISVAMPYIERGVAGQYPVTNKLLNAIRTRTGDPTLTRFENALYTIAIEYGRAMAGAASNGMLPEGARTDALELLNTNMNTEQVKSALDLMLQHTRAAQGAIGSSLDQVKGEIGSIGSDKRGGGAPSTAGGDQGVVDWSTLK